MKLSIIVWALSVSLFANEVDRIEKIIADVKLLRSEYSTCKTKLSQKVAPTLLEKTVCDYSSLEQQLQEKDNELHALHVRMKKLLEEKELLKDVIEDFEDSMKLTHVKKSPVEPCTPTVITKEIFNKCEPTIIKEEVIVEKIIYIERKNDKISIEKSPITISKAKTYRVNKKASIYDKINGEIVQTYADKTSFTSNIVKDGWIQITGIFEDTQWKSAKCKSLWIKLEDVTLHEDIEEDE